MATAPATTRSCTLLLALLLLGVAPFPVLANAPFVRPTLEHRLERLAPSANPRVLHLAARALRCAATGAQRLAVIDYSLPSTRPRLWVFDLAHGRLLFEELVSHGRGSGMRRPRPFPMFPRATNPAWACFAPWIPTGAGTATRCACKGSSPASTIAPWSAPSSSTAPTT